MKSFIVPVDFSEESINGLKMALLFSRYKPVDIEMLYVIGKSSENPDAEAEQEKQKAEHQFQELVREFTPALGKESSLDYAVKYGRIYQQVVDHAKNANNAMITASTHGASGFQEFFIGSNAYRIISATECPVITLRKNKCPESIDKIVLPIDITSDTRQKVPLTVEMARLFNATVHILGIHSSKSESAMKKVRLYVSQVSGYVEEAAECIIHEVHGDSVSEMVVNYAVAVEADLISITTERSSGISLIIGNAAHQLLNKAESPVLCQTPKAIRKSGTFVTSGG